MTVFTQICSLIVSYTAKNGFVDDRVYAIYQDTEANLWFGTHESGVFRYAQGKFHNYTVSDGLASNSIKAICEDKEGHLWFGTGRWHGENGNGVSRYDGKKFVTYTVKDGLAGNSIHAIHEDHNGHLWFATHDAGVSRFDGITFQSIDARDGLAHNTVRGIGEDRDGYLWFTTEDGVTRFRGDTIAPKVHFVAVTTHQRYTELSKLKPIPTHTRVTIEYTAIDLKTHPDKRLYRYRVSGLDMDWQEPTHATAFESTFDKPGTYTFFVQAIDRDLNYSQAASLTLTVVSPWYQNGWILYPSASGILALVLFASVFAYRYYQERQRVVGYQREAVLELADARRVQMGLMPLVAPTVEGLEIAGRCVSANTVSGDFFDYLQRDGQLAIVVGDVTGHGMQGAMNAVMTDGILRSIAGQLDTLSPETLITRLNNDLVAQMEEQMNVTMVIGHINTVAKTLVLANAGHHAHPLLIRSGTVDRLVSKGMPLGMMASIGYRQVEFPLASGDVLVFMTDGIIEAKDSSGQEYQDTGRLQQVLGSFTPDMTAEAMVSALIDDATTFGANMTTEEEDDITVVVVKVL